MIKKNKIILSVMSIIGAISIVPIVAISCGTTSTIDDNKSKVESNVTALKNLQLTANNSAPGTAEQAIALLPKNSTNLSTLDKFFNIKTLESIATQNGVVALYSVVLPPTKPVVNTMNLASATDNALTISVQLSLGDGTDAVTETQNVTITNFPNADQVVVNNYITQIETLTGDTAISGKNNVLISTLTNENISTNLNNVPAVPTIPAGIILSYNIKSTDVENDTVIITISASSPLTQIRTTINITVGGFLSPNQSLVDTYISQIETLTGDKVITGNNTILPTTLTNLTIAAQLTNVPVIPSGVSIIYTLSNANDITGSIDIIINASAQGAITKSSTTIKVNGFLTNVQTAIQTYINLIDNLATGIITGNNTISPSDLTNENISQNLNNVPPAPEGLKITYAISNPDPTTGSIDIVINASAPSATAIASNPLAVDGFLTTNQLAIKTYITNFDANNPPITVKNIVLPSSITDLSNISLTNIANIVNGIIAPPAGITATFNITSQDDITGTIGLTVSLTGANAQLVSSTSITISGFLTTNQSEIDTYITNFNKAPIAGISTILPSTIAQPITSENMSTFFTGIPPLPANATVVFSLTEVNNSLGTLSLAVTLSFATNSSSKTSNVISIKGFKTSQIALSELTTALSKTYASTGKTTTTPTQVYTELKVLADAGTLTIESFNTYFDISQIKTPLAALASSTISSILLKPINSSNTKDGTLSFDLNLSFDSLSSIATITLSGFQATTFNSTQNANLAILQTIANNLKTATIVTTTKTTETSQVASTAILGISNLTLDLLTSYFTITDVSSLITNSATNTISLIPLTTENKTSGTLDFSIVLLLGSSPDEVSLNATFTVGGFKTVPNFTLTGALAGGSVFANYWATTPPTTNLGNSTSVNSLYIPGTTEGVNTFNSLATLPTTGTDLPSFITNITWPAGLSGSDVTSWTMTGTTAGVATYNLIFNNKLTAELTFTGFMNTNIVAALNLISINKTSNIATLSTPTNGALDSSGADSGRGIAGINWNNLQQSLVGNAVSYELENSTPADGTINFIIVFASGITLSLPVSGYSHP